jgi:hypothetical protein
MSIARTHARRSLPVGPLLVMMLLHFEGCAGNRAELNQPPEVSQRAPSSQQAEQPPAQQDREKPQERQPDDEENRLGNRLLAAPEYAWAGLAYPFKKFAIAYEKHDLLNRALDLFLNDERTAGVFPKFAIGGALSSGIGATAFNKNLFRKGKEARVSYLVATRENQIGEAFFRDPSLFGSQWSLETSGFWLDFDEGNFFPGGNRAQEQDETHFALKQLTWDVTLIRPLVGALTASLTGRMLISDAKGSSRPPATPDSVTGNNSSMTALAIEPGLRFDTRDNPFRPTTGWLLDGIFTYTDQVDRDQFRYLGYRLEVQRYIPVFRGDRVLLLRGYLAKQDSVGGGSIPFYELSLLDLNNGLRGFDRGRWQDEGALLFNVEWRFPVWQDVEGAIFLDEGQVFNNYEDIKLKEFRYSAGAGLRFVTPRKFAFRAQVAASEDGVLAVIKGDLEFVRRRAANLGF